MIKKKIKRILVLLDGSQNAQRGLDYAIAIAKQSHATLTGLHAISFYSMGFQPFFSIWK
ncbi:MAG: universal stress protein [Nitrosopumilus sp.]